MSAEKYWRSLDELGIKPEFQRWQHGEFPEAATEMHRRDFLRLMGASLALSGFGACTKQPIEKIVPYVKQPEEIIPGKPLHFATATTFAGYAQGIVVTSHEGRPTKSKATPIIPPASGPPRFGRKPMSSTSTIPIARRLLYAAKRLARGNVSLKN